jgi:hypothetical protein
MARHCDALCEELIVFPGSRSYSMPRPLAYYLVTTLSNYRARILFHCGKLDMSLG